MKTFQIVLIGVFMAFIVLAVIVFATAGKGNGGQSVAPKVVIWGTLSGEDMYNFIINQNISYADSLRATYVQKNSDTFDQELLKAAANGVSPDLIIVPSDELWSKKDRLTVIPVTSYPDQLYRQTFIEAGQQFRLGNGYLAVPLLSDPLIMYWNRDLFAKANLTLPPQYWDDVSAKVSKLSVVDQTLGISQSALALGEFRNIKNAKEILSSLLFQSGNPIALPKNATEQVTGTSQNTLDITLGQLEKMSSTQAAATFFSQFSDPSKLVYTWNRSLQNSTDAFLSGSLAMYFGFSSELSTLKSRNPNLNFDLAQFPQSKSASRPYVFTRLYGMAIINTSNNKAAALNVISVLTSPAVQKGLVSKFKLGTVRADLVQEDVSDVETSVINLSTIHSKIWLDPDKTKTNSIFQDMIESSASGRNTLSTAITEAEGRIKNIVFSQ